MKDLKITETTDIHNDLLMIEVGDALANPIFYLAYHEKTGDLTLNIPLEDRNVGFEIEEFQKLIERLKLELKDWAVNVADKN